MSRARHAADIHRYPRPVHRPRAHGHARPRRGRRRDDSDGYAEAWYLPDGEQHPRRLRDRGTWYDFFAGKAAANYGAAWGPGFATFQYPNANRASTSGITTTRWA